MTTSTIRATRRALLLGAAALPLPALGQTGRAMVLTVTHGFGPHHAPMVTELTRRFNAEHPGIEVRSTMAADNWDLLLQVTLRNALVGDLPDVQHQALNYLRVLAARGLAQPLDALSGGTAALEALGLAGAQLEAGRLGGRQLGLPFGTALPVIYTNRTLLRRADAGEPAAEWPAITAAARRVAALGAPNLGGYLEYTSTNSWMFQNLLGAFGGRMMNEAETDIAFDGQEGLAAMRVMHEFGAAMGADMTQNQGRQAFNAGTMGVLVRSASGIPAVQRAAEGRFELGIGPFPPPAPGGRLVGAGNGMVMFARDPARQRAAWTYMRWMTAPAAQAALAELTGYVPVNLVAVRDPQYLGAFYAANPDQRMLGEQVPFTTDWYAFPNNPVRIFNAMNEEQRRVLLRQVTPEAGLAAMAAAVRRMLRDA